MQYARWSAGFTLLEMMVVLALIGLLMGLVGPGFVHQIEQSQARDASSRFESELVQLPRWARVAGHPLQLERLDSDLFVGSEPVLTVPAGWNIQFEPQLEVSPRQLCTPSTATLRDQKGQIVATRPVQAPDCQVGEEVE